MTLANMCATCVGVRRFAQLNSPRVLLEKVAGVGVNAVAESPSEVVVAVLLATEKKYAIVFELRQSNVTFSPELQ